MEKRKRRGKKNEKTRKISRSDANFQRSPWKRIRIHRASLLLKRRQPPRRAVGNFSVRAPKTIIETNHRNCRYICFARDSNTYAKTYESKLSGALREVRIAVWQQCKYSVGIQRRISDVPIWDRKI